MCRNDPSEVNSYILIMYHLYIHQRFTSFCYATVDCHFLLLVFEILRMLSRNSVSNDVGRFIRFADRSAW